jgi:hypothetical protein
MGDPDFRQSAEAERAAIVAWLREREKDDRAHARRYQLMGMNIDHSRAENRAFGYQAAADAIERGDHLKGGVNG